MNCLHCGSRAGYKRENELTVNEALSLAEELVQIGCKYLSFIGGEVFLYRGWEKIARMLSDNGVIVNVITNGYLFGNKQVEQVKYAKLANVALSIDGMEQNHNRIRNNPKAFSRLIQTMGRLSNEAIPIGVNTTLLDSNIDDLEDLYIFLLTNHVKVWQLQLANPMGNLSNQEKLPISLENIKRVTAFISQKRSENKMNIYTGDNIGYYDEHEGAIRGLPGHTNYWSGCQAGLTVVGIDSIGNVKGCESLYDDVFIEGNVREISFFDIWNNPENFAYNRKFNKSLLSGKCKNCDMGVYCKAGCRGACYFTKKEMHENAYCIYKE
jgi:radical SAM protein with 4Fe4S-binding SPASM domain